MIELCFFLEMQQEIIDELSFLSSELLHFPLKWNLTSPLKPQL